MLPAIIDTVLLFCYVTEMSSGGKCNSAELQAWLNAETRMMTAAPRFSVGPFHRQFSLHGHKVAAAIPSLTSSQDQDKREAHRL